MSRASAASVERALASLGRALPSDAVRTDVETLERHARDESEVAPSLPDAVVVARSHEQVVAVMKAAHAEGVPVTPRAGGTGRTGGAVPVDGGIVLSFEKLDAICEVDAVDSVAVVEPGVITVKLHDAVEAQGLFYPPDPNSLGSCCLGGNIAENAGGPRAFKYGVTQRYVLGLDVVTADGTTLELGKRTPKGVTGYDLASLVVGSEGTLAIVTRATLRLIPKPESVATMLVLFSDVDAVAKAIARVMATRIVPRCLELLDEHTLALVRSKVSFSVPENAKALLIAELDGDAHALDAELERAGNAFTDAGAIEVLVARSGPQRDGLWNARREMSHALRRSAKHKLAEDIAVPRSRMAALLARAAQISELHEIRMPTYGHAGDGNLHVNFLWNDEAEEPAVHRAIEALMRATIELGGTLSGEHGIGVLKAQYLPIEQSPELIALEERVKALFDPRGILNPGKIFPSAVRPHAAC